MNEDAELQARIAALAGQINKRRQQAPPPQNQSTPRHQSHFNGGAGRWAPYGRNGFTGFPLHHNRTLVLGGKHQAAPLNLHEEGNPRKKPVEPLIRACRAGTNQLMTKEAYDREQRKQLDTRGKQTAGIAQRSGHKHTKQTSASRASIRELEVGGIRFQLLNDGSKLIRVSDPSTDSTETPKRVSIAGVDFLRTKHGNLVRASMPNSTPRQSKRAKPQCENFTKHGTHTSSHETSFRWSRVDQNPRSREAGQRGCAIEADIRVGNCTFGPSCKFTHDPTKVAVCKDFLRSGSCKSGRDCDLSHELTYHRVPACTHFLRGNCTSNACRYPHVNTPSTAPVCRPFATLGFCSKGPACDRRHVFECPDYSNHGQCDNREKGSCSLPHVDRAGNLRKAAKRQAKNGFEDESDMSSDEEQESDRDMVDIDSDVAEDDIVTVLDDETHALSQQQDFIPLG